MDILSYSRHFFTSYPEQLAWAQPLVAIFALYQMVPFSCVTAFFGIQFAASDPKLNKLVRFNLRQAINLDIALVLPSIMAAVGAAAAGNEMYRLAPLLKVGSDVVVLVGFAAVLYSVVSSALGVLPNKIPLIGAINRENQEEGKDTRGDQR
ncbi:unnamed protein product [Discosporangium mesarthrocarpum]